jgi:hypothetical protein
LQLQEPLVVSGAWASAVLRLPWPWVPQERQEQVLELLPGRQAELVKPLL